MRETPGTLEDLRSEIDQIDDALQDLLVRRAAVTRSIAQVKHGGAAPERVPLAAALRPAREALILRRLLARHGELPPPLVVGIWREIIAASLRAQSDFHAHVYAEADETAYVGMARTYFGSATPIRTHSKVSLVVHACAEERNALGVVPLPEMEEPGASWWAQLAPAGERGPRVIARLPVTVNGDDSPAAYVIGAIEHEPTGDDTTLLLLEIPSGMSRARLQAMLKDAGLAARLAARGRTSEKTVPDEVLLELKGFVGKDDKRLAALQDAAGDTIARIALIGGFANPVAVRESKGQR